MILADNILHALVRVDPDHQAVYEESHRRFKQELAALDEELKNVFQGRQGMKFMVFHPSWGYLAHDYGLVQVRWKLKAKSPNRLS